MGRILKEVFFTGGGEAVTTLGQDLHQVVSQVATSQIQTEDGVGQSVTYFSIVIVSLIKKCLINKDLSLCRTFIDGDGVGDTITGVQDDTSGTTGGIEGEDSLDGDVHGRAVEGLEHDLQGVNIAIVTKKKVS